MTYLYDVSEKLIFDYSYRLHAGRPDMVIIGSEVRDLLVRGVSYAEAISIVNTPQDLPAAEDVSLVVQTVESNPEVVSDASKDVVDDVVANAEEVKIEEPISEQTIVEDVPEVPAVKRRGRRKKNG